MGPSRLFDVLAALSRRGQAMAGAAGLLWCLAAIVIGLLTGCWLDLAFELSPSMRVAALASAALVGAATFASIAAARILRTTRQCLARRLDLVAGTGGQILAGVDLAALSANSFVSPLPALSQGLATIAIQRAAVLAGSMPASRIVPLTPILHAAAAVAAIATSLVMLAVLLPDPAKAVWLRLSDPYGDHPPYSFTSFRVEPGETTVRYGDSLDVFVTTEGRAVNGVELVLQPHDAPRASISGQIVPMFQEPSGRWRASLAEVKDDAQYFVRARRARTSKFSIRVLTTPQIEQVRFRMMPPAYSRLPVYEGGLPEGGMIGLRDTRVEVRIRSNRPLRSATARLMAGEQVLSEQQWPATIETNEVSGSFTLDRAGRLEVYITDVAGQRSRETFSAGLAIVPDERPFVRMLEPRATSFATPSSRLPIVVSAEDDFGVARLELFRALNDSRYMAMTIPLPGEPPRRAIQSLHLPLDQYGLSPGDEIKLFARVEDNDPAGGKGAESAVVTVRIISEEEFSRMIRTRDGLNVLLSRYQEAHRRLESLSEEMEQIEKKLVELPADSNLSDDMRADLDKLAERMNAEAEAIRRLGQSPLPYELDKQLSKHLERLADELGELSKSANSLAASPSLKSGTAAEDLARLRKALRGDRDALEEQTGPSLELLAAIYPLLEDEARFTDLYQRQRDLAERLSALRGRDKQDDPALKARMRDLESEQQRLKADLDELLDDIDNHARRLPNRPEFKELRQSSEVFASLVRRSEAEVAMTATATALAEFLGTEAHQQAQRAAAILESFLSKCQGIGEQGQATLKNSFEPSLGQSIGDTLAQLLAEAGYGAGSGLGAGGGSGYSARRNSLANVGLYGGLPALGGSRSGAQRNASSAGAGSGRNGSDAQTADDLPGADMSGSRASAAGGEASVPLEYRRRVGRYFQRLADELGNGAAR